jgi:hypothetical protein
VCFSNCQHGADTKGNRIVTIHYAYRDLTETQFWTLVGIDSLLTAERMRASARRAKSPLIRSYCIRAARSAAKHARGHLTYAASVQS